MCGCRGWEDRHAPMLSEVVGWGRGEKFRCQEKAAGRQEVGSPETSPNPTGVTGCLLLNKDTSSPQFTVMTCGLFQGMAVKGLESWLGPVFTELLPVVEGTDPPAKHVLMGEGGARRGCLGTEPNSRPAGSPEIPKPSILEAHQVSPAPRPAGQSSHAGRCRGEAASVT